jgi:hypothetical protein
MPNQTSLRPGQRADRSGQYGLTGPRGGDRGREATITKGEPAPPTPHKGESWKLSDPTRHKK